MTNGIYPHDIYRDDESVSTWSEFSSRRSDFPDGEVPSLSVYSTIEKTIRSWIRPPKPLPLPPPGGVEELGSCAERLSSYEWGRIQVQSPTLRGSHALEPSGPPKILPIETPAISMDELSKLTGYFDQNYEVGAGSCGWVFHTILSTGEAATVRKLNACSLQGTDSVSDFAAQLSEVSMFKHDHFVGLLGYYLDAKNQILVHPLATKGSLHDILHGRKGLHGAEPRPVLTWNQRVKIAYGAARGLEFLHANGIVHGDVCSSSILVFDDFVSKIAGSGWTGDQSFITSTEPLGRLLFGAPEYYMTGVLTNKSDVYNFGVVLLELLIGRKPVDRRAIKGQRSLVLWATKILDTVHQYIDPKLNTAYPPEAVELMAAFARSSIQYEECDRPTMSIIAKVLQTLFGGDD